MSVTERIEEVTKELCKLQRKQDKLLLELKDLGRQATAANNAAAGEATFQQGTRITIKDPTVPLGRAIVAGNRAGTVTRVTSKKVFFNTDSGQINKSRWKKNVIRLVAWRD